MTGDLQFDRAEPQGPSGPTVCAACRRPIADLCYTARSSRICGDCKSAYDQQLGSVPAATRFIRASLFGLAGAVVGAVINYMVTVKGGWGSGLISLLIGYLVGTGVRKGSGNRGGWRYQTLAMALTYLSIIGMFVPEMVRAGLGPQAYLHLLIIPFLGKMQIFLLFLIGIALYEAWQLNRGVTLSFKGPYRIGSAPGKQAGE
jgi:hypothetical protein